MQACKVRIILSSINRECNVLLTIVIGRVFLILPKMVEMKVRILHYFSEIIEYIKKKNDQVLNY